jgi:hypothetical protein
MMFDLDRFVADCRLALLRTNRTRIVAPVGRNGVEALLDVVADSSDKRVPEIARGCLVALGAHLRVLKTGSWSSTG